MNQIKLPCTFIQQIFFEPNPESGRKKARKIIWLEKKGGGTAEKKTKPVKRKLATDLKIEVK